MIRPPAVAGRFYPAHPSALAAEVKKCAAASPGPPPEPAIACLVPHAGYVYSGQVAGSTYAAVKLPRRFVLAGPRHYPQGQALAIISQGCWNTPLGDASIDERLAAELKKSCARMREDELAHRSEHAIEVQLPFLQVLAGDFVFVPVAVGPLDLSELEDFGHALAEVLARQSEPALLIASSDLNHYESDAISRVKDRAAINQILALNPRGLYETVQSMDVSMCGYGAAVAVLTAARDLRASSAKLIRYANSGQANGDLDEVVGYAGIVIQ